MEELCQPGMVGIDGTQSVPEPRPLSSTEPSQNVLEIDVILRPRMARFV